VFSGLRFSGLRFLLFHVIYIIHTHTHLCACIPTYLRYAMVTLTGGEQLVAAFCHMLVRAHEFIVGVGVCFFLETVLLHAPLSVRGTLDVFLRSGCISFAASWVYSVAPFSCLPVSFACAVARVYVCVVYIIYTCAYYYICICM